jgi:hypothetical protein
LPGAGISRRHAWLIRAVAALQTDIAFGDERFFRRRAIAQRLALLVERQERGLADAFPFGGAFALFRRASLIRVAKPFCFLRFAGPF